MPSRAHVTSVEAIEAFRAKLILYLSKARPALEEVGADVSRTRVWLENDQRIFWEKETRRRAKVLEQAKQDLFSAELANLREATVAERMAVNKAKRALDEAEAKLRIVRKWNREFGGQVEPLVKRLERLHSVFAQDLPQAVAHLSATVKALDAYANLSVPESQPPSAPSEDGAQPNS